MAKPVLSEVEGGGVLASSGSWQEWPCPPLLRRYIFFISFYIFFNLIAVGASDPFISYSGEFSADQPTSALISRLIYVDKPRKLDFKVLDASKKPSIEVQVVEVCLTTNTEISFKNASGLSSVLLREPGIYEIKFRRNQSSPAPFPFFVKIYDDPSFQISTAPNLFPLAPPKQPSNKDTELIPSISLKTSPNNQENPRTHTASMAVRKHSPPPGDNPSNVSQQATETKLSEGKDISSPTTKIVAKEIFIKAGDFSIASFSPGEIGFANPYNPVEVRYNNEIPAQVPFESLIKTYIINSMGEIQFIEGERFLTEKKCLKFFPSNLAYGAKYYVQVFNPVSNDLIASAVFKTLPELSLVAKTLEDSIRVEISWQRLSQYFPSDDGQVVRLEGCEVFLKDGESEILRFPISKSLPPVGNLNGISFQGKPFNFSLNIPRSKIPSTKKTLLIQIFAKLIDRQELVKIVEIPANLDNIFPLLSSDSKASQEIPPDLELSVATDSVPSLNLEAVNLPATSTDLPFDGNSNPVSGTTDLINNSAELASKNPILATQPTVILMPVIPIPDPGPQVKITFVREFSVTEENIKNQISWPRGLAWGPKGSLWVSDNQARRLLCFSEEGRFISAFGTKGRGPGLLGMPIDILATEGMILVSDTAGHCVHLYNEFGDFIRDIGVWGVKDGQIDLPHGIALNQNQLWIADRGNCRISRFNLDGIFRGSFGSRGELLGYLNNPLSVKFFGDSMWVLDGKIGRLQCFNSNGKLQHNFLTGSKETSDLEVDPWGYLWVVDSESRWVIRFDLAGKVLNKLEFPDGLKSWIPTAISVRVDGLIAVSDGKNRSIHIFKMAN